MRQLFKKRKTKQTTGKDHKDERAKQTKDPDIAQSTKQQTGDPGVKQVQAILLFSLRPLCDPNKLLQQITEQQRSKGHSIAPKCIAKGMVTKDLSDNTFISAVVKNEFPAVSAEELIKRANVYPFQGSDGNAGKYCVVFDRA